jgi:hypothetical protein
MIKNLIFLLFLLAAFLSPEGQAAGILLYKTGQLNCFDGVWGSPVECRGSGQDGELRTGAAWPNPRFTNPDGSLPISGEEILDRLTGLIWAKDVTSPTRGFCTGGSKDWGPAFDYIKCLNDTRYLNHDDWRMPNTVELASLHHDGQIRDDQWLETFGFVFNKFINIIWSSTTNVKSPDKVFYGLPYYLLPLNHTGKSALQDSMVWPVRGGGTGSAGNGVVAPARTGQTGCYFWEPPYYPIDCPGTGQDGELRKGAPWPEPRFANTDGGWPVSGEEVLDRLTGLIWTRRVASPGPQTCQPLETKSWGQALVYIQCLNRERFLGRQDWRLPNVVELQSLTNHQAHDPAFPTGHPFTDIDLDPAKRYLWTSTTLLSNPSSAHGYDLLTGGVYSLDKFNGRYYAWPLRGGELGAIYRLFLPLLSRL